MYLSSVSHGRKVSASKDGIAAPQSIFSQDSPETTSDNKNLEQTTKYQLGYILAYIYIYSIISYYMQFN